jgi:hypothetical protein
VAVRYVQPNGSDANAGTGPGNGDAWLTPTKALGAAGVASGDTVHIAPGRYAFVTVNMTSPTAETFVLGDPDASEFPALEPGPVVLTAYTSGDDAASTANPGCNVNGRDFLTFEDIAFIGGATAGNPSAFGSSVVGAHHITLRRCLLWATAPAGSRVHVSTANAPDIPFAWLIDSCIFSPGYGQSIVIIAADSAGASDYDIDFVIRNCLFFNAANASYAVRFESVDGGGTGAGKPSGGRVENCTAQMALVQVITVGGNGWSTVAPLTVYNSVGMGLSATLLGQLVEDYNVLFGPSSRVNVGIGANSFTQNSKNWLWELGQNGLWGLPERPVLTPWGTPGNLPQLLGVGSHAGVSLATDILGRPRPAGGQGTAKAAGAREMHDTTQPDATGIGAGVGHKIVGPGDQDIPILVDATSHTISVIGRYDTNHGATNKPQVRLLANPSIGVAAQTLTMTAAANMDETLTFSAFTPTEPGHVILRFVSRSAAGNGEFRYDTIGVV